MPAGRTYTPIARTTVTGSTVNDVAFSSLPQTYTDIVIVMTVRNSNAAAADATWLYFNNGVNPSSGSMTTLWGNGTSAGSGRRSNDYAAKIADNNANNAAGGVYTTIVSNIMNYSNSTTNKTVLTRSSDSTGYAQATVSLWRETAAITKINIATLGSGYFMPGSTFTLYGIAAA